MYCKNCGKDIEDDSKFCQYCGQNVVKIYAKANTEDIATTIAEPEVDPVVAKYISQAKQKLAVVAEEPITPESKKRKRIKIIALVLTIIIVLTGISALVYNLIVKDTAKDVILNGIKYQFDSINKSYFVVGVENKELTSAIIKSEINSYPVTAIGSAEMGRLVDGPFKYCQKLMTVTIPNSIKVIGYDAFLGCSELKSIVIPDSVTEIGYSCFANCTSLTKITLPKNLKVIKENMFLSCTNLTNVTIFNSVTSIEMNAFNNCTTLKEIALPDSITSLQKMVFWGCKELKTLRIPKNVTYIPEYFTFDCENLEAIYIPKSVKRVGKSAIGFNYSRVVGKFYYQGTKAEWGNIIIEEGNNQMTYLDNLTFNSYPKL